MTHQRSIYLTAYLRLESHKNITELDYSKNSIDIVDLSPLQNVCYNMPCLKKLFSYIQK